MKTALFINGVYATVLEEIISSQAMQGGGVNYLQPYKRAVIQMLKNSPPTMESPVTLYISTTKNLKNICYTAEIIDWRDKRELTNKEKTQVLAHLREYQPGEKALFAAEEEVGEKAVNLLTLRNVAHCTTLLPTSVLRKKSDGLALKPRTRAGGWSEVFDVGDILMLPTEPIQDYETDLNQAVEQSKESTEAERRKRLASAERLPERVQLLSTGFRRNADVIIEVLRRSAGVCEKCKRPAPFLRRSDGMPFLEVHHWQPLCKGGEDTVENAGALCPNCHREAHFG
ncbi:MAG: HNH endonuclease signature motif containing protein [Candidatus Omnitrophota bacterium]|jgi:predicted HNH restriction endonuclease